MNFFVYNGTPKDSSLKYNICEALSKPSFNYILV